MSDPLPPIVFLHIPKTAGQTIHNALARMVGAKAVSPIRLHSQARDGRPQMPPGYSLYSGHIDWIELDSLPRPRFVFTVLRDPYERIASFYFFLLREARALSEADLALPQNTGKRMVLTQSAEVYFFGGSPAWQRFIADHYDNFYCSYLATRKIRSNGALTGQDDAARVAAAMANLPLIDKVYSTLDLQPLEADIAERYGQQIQVVGKYVNSAGMDRSERRWPKLLERMESDAAARRLERFVTADQELIDRLGLTV